MTDEERLIACFRSVFPKLADPEIRGASMRTLGAWDSASLLLLLSRVEREFRVRFDQVHIDAFTSFASVLHLLRTLPAPPNGR